MAGKAYQAMKMISLTILFLFKLSFFISCKIYLGVLITKITFLEHVQGDLMGQSSVDSTKHYVSESATSLGGVVEDLQKELRLKLKSNRIEFNQ